MQGSDAKVGVDRLVVGWREWLALPEIGIPAIKAKIDTGARAKSSIHARDIEPFEGVDGREWSGSRCVPICDILSSRWTAKHPHRNTVRSRSSSGHPEDRFFIVTTVAVGGVEWEIEVSLTCRKQMKFRMLLGREALRGRCLVEPHTSFLTGKKLAKYYKSLEGRTL